MNFDLLCKEVIALTGREELAPQIASFVKQAVFEEHSRAFYSRDLVEYEHTLTTEAAHVALALTDTPFVRFRAMHAVYPFDVSGKDLVNGTTGRGNALTPLEANDLVDDYGYQRTDCYYIAGNYINIRFRIKLAGIVLAYAQSPDIFGANFDSWIARDYPYAIIHEAAAKVFAIVKNEAMVKLHRGFAQDSRNLMLPFVVESAIR